MAVDIHDLRGMTDAIAAKLIEKGIKNNEQLLEATKTPPQRKELAAHCGVEARAILELANRADLSRIKGIGGVYSDLLEKAGVDTVPELSQRRADNLHAKMTETNKAEELTKQPPTLKMVEDWVAQAKALDRAIQY